jgi:hypothetical protein
MDHDENMQVREANISVLDGAVLKINNMRGGIT